MNKCVLKIGPNSTIRGPTPLTWDMYYDIISIGRKALGFLKGNLPVSNTAIKSRAYLAFGNLKRTAVVYGITYQRTLHYEQLPQQTLVVSIQ
jgi:hypothetical protein